MIVSLLHQHLYINHFFIQTVYSLLNILQRVHLNLVSLWYKLTWTRQANQTWNHKQQGNITLHFYHVILLTIIYAMILPVGDHYGMNMFWTPIIFLFMEQECYQDQIRNQIPKRIFFGKIIFIYLIHLVISTDLLTLILVPISLNPTNILLYVIENLFSLLVSLSVLFHLFSLLSPFLKLLNFQKGNGTRPSAYNRIYTASILVLLFIVK